MPFATQPPETDLIVPLPRDGESWDPWTIHTHYFGFTVPEAEIGSFIYIRYQPAFPLSQGGLVVFRGLDGLEPSDSEFIDYRATMPYPTIEGNTFTTYNGLRIEFLEPGRKAHITFASEDGETSIDLIAEAVTPLLARGHVMPGEEVNSDPGNSPGGSEQFMHMTGELVLRGARYPVDCMYPRDRSWRQVRNEVPAMPVPPVGWTPMYFGADLIFNQVGFEAPETDPDWSGLYELPADRPTHHFGWISRNGEILSIARVRRNVLERHPQLHSATRQEVEAEDERGDVHHFSGEAIAVGPIPFWPNATFRDSVFRWEDEHGRVTHSTFQEIWFDGFQRTMKQRHSAVGL